MKHYLGFAIRTEERKIGTFFKRKKQEETFCKLRVGADSFAEAQDAVCVEMLLRKMTVAIIFPFTEEDMK